MIKYNLICECGKSFESWFSSSVEFEALRKKNLISWMNPSEGKKMIDVACGTGDIGKLYLNATNIDEKIFCLPVI